ncbi:MAG TPA: biosynthetic-type acetolactate synthase large subunit [Thermoplasmata archaeon]|nr:biosynthetic-type acetolactate synthase large subunit [Thermoplasmata archaeon]
MKGARAAIEMLKEHGVKVAFGHPGGAILPFYDELYDSGIRHILTRHEQNAAHMADGFARVLKRPGVCIATSGPGATNLITGIATAYMDSSPIVAITGQVATSVMGNDAFQEVDTFGIMMPIVKHNWRIEKAEDIPRVFREAFYLCTHGRFAPVHIDLPLDVQRDEVPEAALKVAHVPRKQTKKDLSRLLDAIRFIEEAEAPVILVGGGGRWSQAGQEVLRLAELIHAPVVTTLMGKGSVPEDHPLVLGPVGMHGKMVATHTMSSGDTIIALGTRFSDRSTGKLSEFGKQQRIVHVDIDSSEVGKNVPHVVGLVGDLYTVVHALIAGLEKRALRKQTEWTERVGQWKRECACDFNHSGHPLLPQKIIWELNRLLPDDAILTTEVGRHQMWAEHFFDVRRKRMFITSGGLGTMGFGFPAALGAKIAAPGRFVMDLAGDGSFQMTMKELATARQNGINVGVLIMNDSSLGMVWQWQKMWYNERYSGVDLGKIPDFVKIAEAYGCDGVRVERQGDLPDAIGRAMEADAPFVIDAVIDPNELMLPIMPPGKSAKEVILGPRCIWKGGVTAASPIPARA